MASAIAASSGKRASKGSEALAADGCEAKIPAARQAIPRLHAYLRECILDGTLTPGTKLSQVSLARQLGVSRTPLREVVKGFCEILGLDPLYLANEGKLVAVVPAEEADRALAALRRDPLGLEAAVIGRVEHGEPGRVTMRTAFGGRRIVDMLVGEQLPRIC